jgi:hypothetical protein
MNGRILRFSFEFILIVKNKNIGKNINPINSSPNSINIESSLNIFYLSLSSKNE